jgi:ubiquinone/menaquinone biosynthesis C-methylase UbiE
MLQSFEKPELSACPAMSTMQEEFDRIALVSPDGATHNDHYHNFLLLYVPANCQNALDIGCGTGSFARRLAERSQQVLALDLSAEMIRIARERSEKCPNIDFQLVNVMDMHFDDGSFDCIATIATLHHLPFEEVLLKMRRALKPGGIMLILDLFEPSGIADSLSNLVALPISTALRLIHHGRLLPRREERAAWNAHARHDSYPTIAKVQSICERILPGAKIRKHLLWRYSVVWEKKSDG